MSYIACRGHSGRESACQCRSCKKHGFDPWVRKIPGGGNDYPLQYSCLENPTDRGAWGATVHRVAKSQTQLSTNTHLLGNLTTNSAEDQPNIQSHRYLQNSMLSPLICMWLIHIQVDTGEIWDHFKFSSSHYTGSKRQPDKEGVGRCYKSQPLL